MNIINKVTDENYTQWNEIIFSVPTKFVKKLEDT